MEKRVIKAIIDSSVSEKYCRKCHAAYYSNPVIEYH